MPMRQLVGLADASAASAGGPPSPMSGLCGARLVAKTWPTTTRSSAARWTEGWSGIEDRDQVVAGRTAGHRGEVVGAVDRRPVEAVVGARDDDRPDPGLGQALELGGDALDRAARLDVRVEQVAGDQEEVDLLGQGKVDGRLEGRELALALGGRLLSEIVVSRTEMDVRGVDDPEHRVAAFASSRSRMAEESPRRPGCRIARAIRGDGASEAPP